MHARQEIGNITSTADIQRNEGTRAKYPIWYSENGPRFYICVETK